MPRKTKAIKKSDHKKAWAKRKMSARPYPVEQRDKAKSFLIICEGYNTEPCYFKSFPLGNAEVESYGVGSSKTALVEQVLGIVANDEDARLQEIWVVFDFDIKHDQLEKQKVDFNNAIELAHRNNIKVACSNDSFELWFLLHYQFLDLKWTRHEYYDKLSELWECNYSKNGKEIEFCRKIYQRLEEDERADQNDAIKRAKRLHDKHSDLQYAEKNPYTSVYQLVDELNQYLI
jgi:hypothetical protein